MKKTSQEWGQVFQRHHVNSESSFSSLFLPTIPSEGVSGGHVLPYESPPSSSMLGIPREMGNSWPDSGHWRQPSITSTCRTQSRAEQAAGCERATRWHCGNYMAGCHASGLGLFFMDYAKPVREIFNTTDMT